MSHSNDFYDVLIAYNSADEEEVEEIVNLLKDEGITSWFAKDIHPGENWIDHFAEAIPKVVCAAIFLGSRGLGCWQEHELRVLVEQSRRVYHIPLIPVLMPHVSEVPNTIGILLPMINPVIFQDSVTDQNPLCRLIDAIKQAICDRQKKYAFEIEIDVAKAEQSCFLAMPKEGLDDVYDAVKQAIIGIGTAGTSTIKLIQTREAGDRDTFTNDVVHAIRESEMVIAVCTPQEGTGSLCPEVMYELGMAHSLGKPTVLLTTERIVERHIPCRVKHIVPTVEVVEYHPGELQSCGLAETLKTVNSKIREPFLVDSEVEEIHAIRSELTYMRSVLWRHFHTIISFGIETHHEIRDLMQQSHTLLTDVEKLSQIMERERIQRRYGEAFAAHCQAFEKGYNALSDRHEKWEERYYKGLEKTKARLTRTFKFLCIHLPKDLSKTVELSKDWYNIVVDDIKYYRERFQKIREYATDRFECFRYHGPTKDLKHQVEELDSALRLLYRDTHNMMSKLLEIIVEGKGHDN